MGIIFPCSYCDELETVPHYWIGVEHIAEGVLYQCKFCYNHLWLPLTYIDADRLGKHIKKYGNTKGYCQYLDKHRPAKLLMAKLQDLRRLEMETTDKREFAKIADKILSDREYDRKEVES